MALSNTSTRYGSVARGLHWLVALLVLTLLPLGLVANALPAGTDAELARKAALFSLHKTLGIAALFAGLLRITWALGQTRPVPLHPERRAETWLAETVHRTIYVALILVPLTGWVHHAATDGFAPILWPLGQSLPLVPKSEAVAQAFGAAHWLFTKLLGVAVLLHVAGALKHAVADRDATLTRMTRGRAAGDPDAPRPGRAPALSAAALWTLAVLGAMALALPALRAGGPADAVASGGAGEWTVESGTLGIEIRQLGQPVTGRFGRWSADIAFDPEAAGPVMGSVTVRVDVSSLTLGSVTEQALTGEFLAAEAHPEAVFAADILRDEGGGYLARGTLDLKGASLPATLPFSLDLAGETATAEGSLTLDRREFGIGAGYSDEGSLGFAVPITVSLTARRAAP